MPFISATPGRSAFEHEKESLRNEQRRQDHIERRLHERVEELLDSVAPLSVVLRSERMEQLLEGLGASRFSSVGEIIGEVLNHLRNMRKSVTDSFGVIPSRAELIRMVMDALPEFYEDTEADLDEEPV